MNFHSKSKWMERQIQMLSWILRNQKMSLKNRIICSILHNYCTIDMYHKNCGIITLKNFDTCGNIFIYCSKITSN